MTHNLTRKAFAGLSAVAMVATMFGASMAVADDKTVSGAVNPSSITEANGSLTITKLTPSTDPNHTVVNDGNVKTTPTGSKPINNVKFTAMKVEDVDLTTNEGWLKAKAIANVDDAAGVYGRIKPNLDAPTSVEVTAGTYAKTYTLTDKGTQTTAGQGVANFASLPVGLYLVYETVDVPVNIVGGEQNVAAERVTKAKPFFVTIPIANAERTGWNYDLNVYPKNNLQTIPTKTVDDNTNGVGAGNDNTDKKSEIVYTLGAKVPGVAKLKHFDLVDKFKTADLEWINEGANDEVKVGDTLLTKGADQDFTFETQTSGDYTFVAMVLTEKGRAKILAEGQGKEVTWKMHAKVKGTAEPKEIPNEVYLTEVPENGTGGKWTPDKPGTPGDKVKSYYGKVEITKKGQKGEVLEGAEFELYQCHPTTGAKLDGDKKVAVDGKDKWVSGKDGKIVISGLLVNDFRNNSVFVNGKDGAKWVDGYAYCLKETKAPEGYALLPQPIKFQVLSTNGTAVPVKVDMDVTNTKNNGGTPTLPVTGGAGIGILVAAGALLLGGSGVYAYAAGRKRKQH